MTKSVSRLHGEDDRRERTSARRLQGERAAHRERRVEVRAHAAVRGAREAAREVRRRGLRVLGFPANEFGAQEPGTDDEIEQFCTTNYGVKFDMFAKVVVKGEGIAPALRVSSRKRSNFAGDIKWNFNKFLVGKRRRGHRAVRAAGRADEPRSPQGHRTTPCDDAAPARRPAREPARVPDSIAIKGAREHNLDVDDRASPRSARRLHRACGSGKSSLAFDTLYAEGQRRYVESLSSYARQFLGQMEKPQVRARSAACRRRSRSSRRARRTTRARPSAPSPRSTTTCACSTRAPASSTATTCGRRVGAQTAERDRRRAARARRRARSCVAARAARSRTARASSARSSPTRAARASRACASTAMVDRSTSTPRARQEDEAHDRRRDRSRRRQDAASARASPTRSRPRSARRRRASSCVAASRASDERASSRSEARACRAASRSPSSRRRASRSTRPLGMCADVQRPRLAPGDRPGSRRARRRSCRSATARSACGPPIDAATADAAREAPTGSASASLRSMAASRRTKPWNELCARRRPRRRPRGERRASEAVWEGLVSRCSMRRFKTATSDDDARATT